LDSPNSQPPGGASGPHRLTAVNPPTPSRDERAAGADGTSPLDVRLMAVMAAARYHGVELDREDLRFPAGEAPSPATLVEWVRGGGLWAKAARLRWRHLIGLESAGPVVLLLADGSAALMVRADPARNIVWLKDPTGAGETQGVAVDELRLAQVWTGETLLMRAERGSGLDSAPFTFGWIARMVLSEKRVLRDISIGSLVLSFLTIVPPLLTMVVIDKVITYQSFSTLAMMALILLGAAIYETYLSYARRQLILVIATRLDAKLGLHVFKRLLALPIDFFERTQAGAVMYQLHQVTKIRDFLTGRLLTTVLDSLTLLVLLPFLFWLNTTLTWLVVACAVLVAMIIMLFLPSVRRAYGHYQRAEIEKNTVLGETVHGIRTVKSLALEPQQREMWDRKVADAAGWRKAMGDASNWPQSLVIPFETMMNRGVLMIGAYLALTNGGVSSGALIAFMMLSGRVGQPLVSMAKLVEDVEEVRASVAMVSQILNNRPETTTPGAGLRPKFEGGVRFDKVSFTYPGSKNPALEDITFEIPAGTMLGVVGRSGSGKSTITRLLQGINREYEGYIKVDGNDLREINLAHLRRGFGVVLQENFLFRATIRENLIAGRPGLTLTDAVRAARLAGAEEFIERMPMGYETWIEEGSPNLSGGQRQRLAIARALIHDPRILILDEATSALDPESEALVNANIQRIAFGRTMVIVSHRLSSLVDCHQILVLDQGRVVDMAPHRELLERCAIYRALWQQQNRHMEGAKATPKPVLAQGD